MRPRAVPVACGEAPAVPAAGLRTNLSLYGEAIPFDASALKQNGWGWVAVGLGYAPIILC
jgi:hypothetical protein